MTAPGRAPSWADLAVSALITYVAYALAPVDADSPGEQPSPAGWLTILIPAAMALPVYTALAGRLRRSNRRIWPRLGVTVLCGALLMVAAMVPAAGIGVLCFLSGLLLRGERRTDSLNPALSPVAALALRQRVDAARQEERRRMRYDIHDTLGPTLLGIRLRLDTAAAGLAHDPKMRRLLTEAAAETLRAAQGVHSITDTAPSGGAHGVGLPDALRQLVSSLGDSAPEITLEVPCSPPLVAAATKAALYRIAAESLTNAVRHAGAEHIDVQLTAGGGNIVLEVRDDGTGEWAGQPRDHGIGLVSMARSAEAVGGRCTVSPRSDASSGTVVRAVLPRIPTRRTRRDASRSAA